MTIDDHDSLVMKIRELWQLATPLPEIAASLHLPEPTVRYVIDHSELPEAEPQWILRAIRAAQRGLLEDQPERDHISER